MGYEPDYDNWEGIPNKLPLVAPEGTVEEASLRIGDWSAKYYGVDENRNSTFSYQMITDQVTRDRIGGLTDETQERGKGFLLDALNEEIELRVTTGFRGQTEQNNLFGRNRTQDEVDNAEDAYGNPLTGVVAQPNAAWATNATWGNSYHNFGTAIDVVGYNSSTGQISYDINWQLLENIGAIHGLETISQEQCHFQYTGQ